MKVFIIGTGMCGSVTQTSEAAKAIKNAGLIIGARRMISPYINSGKEVACCYDPYKTAELLSSSSADTAAVLVSGDCGFFSASKNLLPLLSEHDVQMICGISSVSYLCAKSGFSYESMKFTSLHGCNANIAVNVHMNRYCFFLLGGDISAGKLCKILCSYDLDNVNICIGEDLGDASERITKGCANELTSYCNSSLCSVIVENPDCIRHIPAAISDTEFIRENVPMTKAVVRCTAVSFLEIERDSVCWDIGCGTGSVSVEMAYRCPDGIVLAFDRSHEAVELTEKNRRKFHCDNIIVKEGICPDTLSDAAPPDKIFIGGSSGNMPEIFRCILEKNPDADIIVTAVSLETLSQTCELFEQFGGNCEVTQISVTDTRKIGSHTMLSAQNPVFIIRGKLI